MRRVLLFLLPIVLAIAVFLVFMFFASRAQGGKGALQVTSLPQSTVFLDNKPIGKTPLCKCDPQDMLAVGEYTVKVVPIDPSRQPYEEKITINQSVLTVVDRTFGDTGKSSGSVVSLEAIQDTKKAQLFISSFPYGADVSVDSVPIGITPILKQITDSDHEITVSKPGYKTKTVRIHGVLGYKLSTVIYLSTEDITATQPTPTTIQAAASADINSVKVIILSTPTGYLRVRASASISGAELTQVHPNETYPFVLEQNGWTQIKLSDGRLGWVSSQYVKKQ
jgi:hypothetical protein